MPGLRRSETHTSAHNKNELATLQELLAAFNMNGINIPFDRLELILKEYQSLKEQCCLVNEISAELGPSHIRTPIVRSKNHERQS